MGMFDTVILLERLEEVSETKNIEFIKTLKERNRGMIFLLLDKIKKSGDRRFLPVLEHWKSIDYKKVKAGIDSVIAEIGDGRRGE